MLRRDVKDEGEGGGSGDGGSSEGDSGGGEGGGDDLGRGLGGDEVGDEGGGGLGGGGDGGGDEGGRGLGGGEVRKCCGTLKFMSNICVSSCSKCRRAGGIMSLSGSEYTDAPDGAPPSGNAKMHSPPSL